MQKRDFSRRHSPCSAACMRNGTKPTYVLCNPGVVNDEEEGLISGIHPSWAVIDRIIAKGKAGRYLVKWQGLPYADATWEDSLWPSDTVICALLCAFP